MSICQLLLTVTALVTIGIIAAVLEAVGLAFQGVPCCYGGDSLLVALIHELGSVIHEQNCDIAMFNKEDLFQLTLVLQGEQTLKGSCPP